LITPPKCSCRTRCLRALEHFDAFELDQVAEADAVARAVHAVDDTPTDDSSPLLSPTVPMPRMRAVVMASLCVLVTVRPGTRTCMSLMSRTPVSCSNCSASGDQIGTSCRDSSRFCAVTPVRQRGAFLPWRLPPRRWRGFLRLTGTRHDPTRGYRKRQQLLLCPENIRCPSH
jgi:hypothetical protein